MDYQHTGPARAYVEFDDERDGVDYGVKFWLALRKETPGEETMSDEEVLARWVYVGHDENGPETRCICSHPIINNMTIRHIESKEELVVGSVCIKRWMKDVWDAYLESKRKHCDRCHQVHKNRKDNFCKACRVLNKQEEEAKLEEEERKAEQKRIETRKDELRKEWLRRGVEKARIAAEYRKVEENRLKSLGDVIFPFGKHRGSRFEHIRQNDPDYSTWVVGLSEQKVDGDMAELRNYLLEKAKENFKESFITSKPVVLELSFGKHRGKSFAEVKRIDSDYCRWVLAQADPGYLMKPFYDYLKGERGRGE